MLEMAAKCSIYLCWKLRKLRIMVFEVNYAKNYAKEVMVISPLRVLKNQEIAEQK